MPLIIEGADHLGKTTFANLLVKKAEEIGIPAYYSHMSRPPKNWNYYGHYVQRMQPFAVQDRFHLGGIVYGELFHGNRFTKDMVRMLEARLTLMGSLTVVFAYTDDEKYKNHLRKNPKAEMYDIEGLIRVNTMFKSLHPMGAWPIQLFCKIVVDETFPGEQSAEYLVTEWYRRLVSAEQFGELPLSQSNSVTLGKDVAHDIQRPDKE